MRRDELVYVGHMLDEAREAIALAAGLDQAAFLADLAVRKAVLHSIQTIGEAARRVSPQYRHAHPSVPWADVIEPRNKIVHDYFAVSYTVVWTVVSDELPALVPLLAALVPDVA